MAKKLILVTIMLMLLVTSIVSASEKVVIEKNPYKDPKKAFNYVYNLCVTQNSSGEWETYMLGSYYEKGYGTKSDIEKAYIWYKMSTNQDYKPAITALMMLEKKMSKKQISEAEKNYIKVRDESIKREMEAIQKMNE